MRQCACFGLATLFPSICELAPAHSAANSSLSFSVSEIVSYGDALLN